jgi:hypothetical protein
MEIKKLRQDAGNCKVYSQKKRSGNFIFCFGKILLNLLTVLSI